MGKAARLAELENKIERLQFRLEKFKALENSLMVLQQVPEDAYYVRDWCGQRVSCEVGKMVRCALHEYQKVCQ